MVEQGQPARPGDGWPVTGCPGGGLRRAS
jgi:hypothetical protein